MDWSKVNRWHWILISIIVVLRLIPEICTWYALNYLGKKECNPIMSPIISTSWGFMIMAVVTLILLAAIPLWFARRTGQLEHFQLSMIFVYVIIIGVTGFDGTNDVLVLLHSPYAHITHNALVNVISTIGLKPTC